MWTVLSTLFVVVFFTFFLIRLREFFSRMFLDRLENEIENDLREEFSGFSNEENSSSSEFLNWVEELQMEKEISKRKKQAD